MIPTSDHNEVLANDELTSISFNYQWRQIIAPILNAGFGAWSSTIDDPNERQAFDLRCLALYEDFYNLEFMDNTPIGMTAWLPSPTIPQKWHKCDGATLLRSEYPELYDALPDYQFVQVGTGLDIIILPNLSDSFLYGANNDAEIADVGGEVTHVLTVAEMPAHQHSTPNHVNTIPIADNTGTASRVARGGTTNATNFNTNSSGGGTSGSQGSGDGHNNMPPYTRGYWIMKVTP